MKYQIPSDLSILQRASDDARQFWAMMESLGTKADGVIRDWCGDVLSRIQEEIEALLAVLDNPDCMKRAGALLVLRDDWPELEELVSKCARMAFEDVDVMVRGVALYVLDSFSEWIEDPTGALPRLVWNDHLPTQLDINEAKANSARLRYRLMQNRRDVWFGLVGQKVNQMLRSRQFAEDCLSDTDIDTRYVALAIMYDEWKPTRRAAALAEEALNHGDARIREAGIAVLYGYYSHKKEFRIARLLAKVAADESQPSGVRCVAHRALCAWGCRPTEVSNVLGSLPAEFNASRDIDYEFLALFGAESPK
jgi:hypothetical protein